jgi:Anthrax toxin lethal factor, N- and C-terminal domain
VPSKLWPAEGYRSFAFTRADRIEPGDYIGTWQVEKIEHGNRAGSTRVILKGGARILLGPNYRLSVRRKALRDITPVSEIHGQNLHITDENHWSVQGNMADYTRVPDSHKRLLASRGAQLYFGKESVPGLDTMQKLSNVHPHGYAEGKTWRDAAGAYNWDEKKLLIGNDAAHGSVSLAAHETGHAMDSAVAIQAGLPGLVSGTPEFRRIWRDLGKYKRWVNPYYLQEGQAGPQEAFAESYAAWVITRDRPSRYRAYEIGAALGMRGPGFGSIPGVSGVPDVADRLLAYFDKLDRSIGSHDRATV